MIIDIVVGAVVLISALIAFLRGFIREVLTILGVVGGILAAVFFGPDLAPVMRGWLGVSDGDEAGKLFDLVPMVIVADVLAYGLIFILVVIILSVISHFTAGAAKALGLGPVDRTLGVVFGIVRAVVLLGLLYLPFHLLMDEKTKEDLFSGSKTHIFIEKTADVIAGFLPETEEIEEKAEDVERDVKKKLMEEDLLRKDDNQEAPNQQDLKESEDQNNTGYEQDERQKMNELFKQQPGPDDQ